jgi:hypothetical protein
VFAGGSKALYAIDQLAGIGQGFPRVLYIGEELCSLSGFYFGPL